MNISALPFSPFFVVEYVKTSSDGASSKTYKGPDALLIKTVANALNFTFKFLPVRTWSEVRKVKFCTDVTILIILFLYDNSRLKSVSRE